MRIKALKFAASALAIGTTMVACSPSTQAFRAASASASAAKGDQQALVAYAAAQAAVQKGDLAGALVEAERAVALSPRDMGFRMLLGDLYLKNGRFQSAETTFGDVLTLDPGNERAQLSAALAQIALGRTASALVRLDRLAESAAPGDIGLAYALAGQPQRAIALLEPAARETGANARVRQNLALSYALAGDWQKARVTAAQDVSPAELSQRLQQWAAFAQPKASWDQVASLLNVTPAHDPGQPERLALAPAVKAPVAMAANEVPAPEPVAIAADPVPVTLAAVPAPELPAAPVSDVPAWTSAAAEAAPEPAEESRPLYAEAVQALVGPQAPTIKASIQATEPRFERAPRAAAPKPAAAPKGPGRFAVQLGAFSSASGVERAWAQAYKRYGFTGRTPYSTTVTLPKGTFHRLSVAGYASHSEASAVCRSVKAKGGACFVRAVAGDAPVRWASRYTGKSA